MFGFKPDPEGLLDALSHCRVTRYGYRQATPTHPRLCGPVEYDEGDTWNMLQHALANAVGKTVDNHETYLVESEHSPEQICIQFSDWKVYIGENVIVKNW